MPLPTKQELAISDWMSAGCPDEGAPKLPKAKLKQIREIQEKHDNMILSLLTDVTKSKQTKYASSIPHS